MSKILQIEEEKVLKLAKKCPQWEDGLKELFPESFTIPCKPYPKLMKGSCGSIYLAVGKNKGWCLILATYNGYCFLDEVSQDFEIIDNFTDFGGTLYFKD